MTQTPTTAEILNNVIEARGRESFGGWLPARIETYDPSTNRAIVQILILDSYDDEEGERQTEPFPPLVDLPVLWPSIGGKVAFRVDLAKGDEVTVMFAARPITKFTQTGGLVDPEDERHHDINDAAVCPWRVSGNGTNAVPCIQITSTQIQAGGTSALALASELNALRTAFNDHGHPGFGSPPSTLVATPYPGTSVLKGG